MRGLKLLQSTHFNILIKRESALYEDLVLPFLYISFIFDANKVVINERNFIIFDNSLY